MKTLGVTIAIIGIAAVWCGATGVDTGLEDKLWMAATIIGVLLVILGILLHQYPAYLQKERAKKSIRYRRYIEMQEKMSA